VKERTLAIIKPDIIQLKLAGKVIDHLLNNRFEIIALKMTYLGRKTAGEFYAVHKDKPFYDKLLDFMTESRVIALALEKENAVVDLRSVVGATNPEDADEGTVRKLFGTDKTRNAIHASDSVKNAEIELAFFFSSKELIENTF
jgi:nucleoside-diphosphate kinase